MQKVYCFITLLFMLSCASFESKYIIEGKLKGKTYDGEFIYLVPVEGATAETVDSVQIKDGVFRFEGMLQSLQFVYYEPDLCYEWNCRSYLLLLNREQSALYLIQRALPRELLRMKPFNCGKNRNETLILHIRI